MARAARHCPRSACSRATRPARRSGRPASTSSSARSSSTTCPRRAWSRCLPAHGRARATGLRRERPAAEPAGLGRRLARHPRDLPEPHDPPRRAPLGPARLHAGGAGGPVGARRAPRRRMAPCPGVVVRSACTWTPRSLCESQVRPDAVIVGAGPAGRGDGHPARRGGPRGRAPRPCPLPARQGLRRVPLAGGQPDPRPARRAQRRGGRGAPAAPRHAHHGARRHSAGRRLPRRAVPARLPRSRPRRSPPVLDAVAGRAGARGP